jgi:addiction module HigA family antidote
VREHKGVNSPDARPGERLLWLLDELRVTQTRLAEMTDVSPQYVNNIVRTQQRITEEFAIKLVDALGVNLNWLFTGKGPELQREPALREFRTSVSEESVDQLLQEAHQRLQKAEDMMNQHKEDEKEVARSSRAS